MDHARIVLGIGNPGPEYEGTRHNVGFEVLDRLAARKGLEFRRLERRGPDGRKLFGGKVKAQVAEGIVGGEKFLLVKPLTYVNLSGDVAAPLLRAVDRSPDRLFVLLDDLNLPLGRLRIRPAGSAGGHNGLKSIEAALMSQAYPRLRLGIGEPDSPTTDYVLARFLPGEREVLDPVLDRAVDIVDAWLSGESLDSLMGSHNGFDAAAPSRDEPGGDPGE
ncbi:MAG: aminoacyl-tRNA hydrolase [Planctomycetes bacterium]|nr:aminoacyl-tRNA hydrolase [Planctomycetota bacterium]